MSTPALSKRLPKPQSFKDHFIEKINAQEPHLILGPSKPSPDAVHPTGKSTPPAGKKPRAMPDTQWIGNL